MSKIDESYHEILQTILNYGFEYEDPNRAGVKRLQVSSYRFEHDLTHSFPAIATKKLAFKSMTSELVWFLQGRTNIDFLNEHHNPIWNKDAYAYYIRRIKESHATPNLLDYDKFMALVEKKVDSKAIVGYSGFPYRYGDLGPVYGWLWRNFHGVDQIVELIFGIINKPMSTEHIVTAWDPSVKNMQALPPCHFGFQVMCRPLSFRDRYSIFMKNNTGKLIQGKMHTDTDMDNYGIPKYAITLEWDQRSVDTFLGLPFNIASYAELTHIIGKMTNTVPEKIIGNLRNVHLYDNSYKAAEEQLKRDPYKHGSAKLLMKDEFHYMCDNKTNPEKILHDLRPDMFKLYNYFPDDPIKVEMLERT